MSERVVSSFRVHSVVPSPVCMGLVRSCPVLLLNSFRPHRSVSVLAFGHARTARRCTCETTAATAFSIQRICVARGRGFLPCPCHSGLSSVNLFVVLADQPKPDPCPWTLVTEQPLPRGRPRVIDRRQHPIRLFPPVVPTHRLHARTSRHRTAPLLSFVCQQRTTSTG